MSKRDGTPRTSPTSTASYPAIRMRRNRRAPWARALVRETMLSANDLVWPMFVMEGSAKSEAIASMPGIARLSVDLIVEAARELSASAFQRSLSFRIPT